MKYFILSDQAQNWRIQKYHLQCVEAPIINIPQMLAPLSVLKRKERNARVIHYFSDYLS